MTKKYSTKKYKKNNLEDASIGNDHNQVQAIEKEKKIIKAPKIKETILSDIELQIVELFSRGFTNGQIGVKFPQQKKKGMMRLMNFCFRTILEQVQIYISQNLKKEAHTVRCIDRKQRTIFHLSSNYRYKHIQKSLLQDFKYVCQTFVKYHCFEHLEPKFLQKFYKKVIYNEFSADTPESYKANSNPIVQIEPKQIEMLQNEKTQKKLNIVNEQKISSKKSPKKTIKPQNLQQTTLPKKRSVGRPPLKKQKTQAKIQQNSQQKLQSNDQQPEQSNQNDSIQEEKQIKHATIEQKQPDPEVAPKSNKICIEKINIYFGYENKSFRKEPISQDKKKLQSHPYARMQINENESKFIKRKWTLDMQSQLIDQFMNTSAISPNIIIRNLMKKFGRNKLFVQSQIQQKKKEMFKVCMVKFVSAFVGKTLCSQDLIKEMQEKLKSMSLSPKNFFIASFIHDFYFKEIDAISVTLLSQYIHKLSRESKLAQKHGGLLSSRFMEDDSHEDKRNYERQNLKYALNTVSKLVSNYTYDLVD